MTTGRVLRTAVASNRLNAGTNWKHRVSGDEMSGFNARERTQDPRFPRRQYASRAVFGSTNQAHYSLRRQGPFVG